MGSPLLVTGAVLAAAAVHVYIFILESLLWSRPSTWRGFGLRSQGEDADTTRPLAYNQGFYNLFLSMVLAAVVLVTNSA